MSTDLEDRLRADLPRLADQLMRAPATADLPDLPIVPLRRRSRRPWLAAAACVALLAGVVAVAALRDPGATTTTATTATTVTTTTDPGPLETWSALPEPPIPGREGAASVWTGEAWLVFGGRQGSLAMSDAAAYDPATRTWRQLVENPTPHPGSQAAWTGKVVVLLAKNGGWTYDPATDRYTDLSLQEPDEAVSGMPVWTGEEVVVIGMGGLSGTRPSARTLDPSTGEWGGISALLGGQPPEPVAVAGTVWDGSRAIAVMADGTTYAYDPTDRQLSALPTLEVPGRTPDTTTSVAAIGDSVYAVVSTPSGTGTAHQLVVLRDGAWELVGARWTSSIGAPSVGDGAHHLVAAGKDLVLLLPESDPVELDPADGIVVPLDAPPMGAGSEQSVAWTGDELLVFGGRRADGELVGGAASLHP